MTGQDARVRFEWGPTGAEAVATGATLVVVVDVLNFTTCVSVAADRGIEVHPYRFQDRSAAEYAERVGAVLSVGRGISGGVSLSPASIAAVQGVDRLVLPSRNGSAIAVALAERGSTVVAGALRNRRAVARWVARCVAQSVGQRRIGTDGGDGVAVVAAGERWPDGSLRPGLEDLRGAGAVLTALAECGVGDLSPEATAAAAAFDAVTDLGSALSGCASGRELVEGGFAEDVRIAGQLDVSDTVPVLDPSVGSFSGQQAPGGRRAGRVPVMTASSRRSPVPGTCLLLRCRSEVSPH